MFGVWGLGAQMGCDGPRSKPVARDPLLSVRNKSAAHSCSHPWLFIILLPVVSSWGGRGGRLPWHSQAKRGLNAVVGYCPTSPTAYVKASNLRCSLGGSLERGRVNSRSREAVTTSQIKGLLWGYICITFEVVKQFCTICQSK